MKIYDFWTKFSIFELISIANGIIDWDNFSWITINKNDLTHDCQSNPQNRRFAL